jgi:hypothetical protein
MEAASTNTRVIVSERLEGTNYVLTKSKKLQLLGFDFGIIPIFKPQFFGNIYFERGATK